MQGQRELFEIVPTLRSAGCFARLLNGGQQQGNQDGDDRDDDKQFDQSEASGTETMAGRHGRLQEIETSGATGETHSQMQLRLSLINFARF